MIDAATTSPADLLGDLPAAAQIDALVAHLLGTSRDFMALMGRYGNAASALRHFGIIQWHEKRLDEAREALSAAAALSPDDARLWADLAGVVDGLSDAALAERCVRRSLALDPGQGRSWQFLASLIDRRGDRQDAQIAYRRALQLDPHLGDAHFGLGILLFQLGQIDEAAASLRAALHHGYANALGYTCLGHVLYRLSDFDGAAAAFERAATFGPLAANARKQFARARTFATIIEGRTEAALAAYPELAGEEREDMATIMYDAFSLLSAYGYRDAAVDVGRRRLAEKPDDPVQRYLLDAVAGRPLTAAPIDYLEIYFDRFAPEFDQKLVDVLRYRTPQLLPALVAKHRDRFTEIVDLGCGTGLAAEALSAFGGTLTGVDLSARMLDEAAKRGCYSSLVKSEVVAYLKAHPGTFDLMFAADIVIYLGDLAPLMAAVSGSLMQAGIFALNVEAAASGDFALLPSGRFAHSPAYVERLANPDFEILDVVETMLRLEADRPVAGYFLVLRRR